MKLGTISQRSIASLKLHEIDGIKAMCLRNVDFYVIETSVYMNIEHHNAHWHSQEALRGLKGGKYCASYWSCLLLLDLALIFSAACPTGYPARSDNLWQQCAHWSKLSRVSKPPRLSQHEHMALMLCIAFLQ